MTDCPHNDHTHVLLWAVVIFAVINSTGSCGGDMDNLERRVQKLEQKCK